MSSAADYYYPDEPVDDYYPEYSGRTPLPEPLQPPERPQAACAIESPPEPEWPPFEPVILPSVRDESLLPEVLAPRAIYSIQQREEEMVVKRLVLAVLIRATLCCKKARAEWTEEQIALYRPFLSELVRAARVLLKPDTRVRRYNPSQRGLFE